MKKSRIFVAICAALAGGIYLSSCADEIDFQDSQELTEYESARVSESEMGELAEDNIDSTRCILNHGGRIGIDPTGRTRVNRGRNRR
ncbi:MAG: hypothetical protein IKO57_04110 [Treponema sp.]|nr:hypothetical protein [Treponema sp.]MBR4629611.1 hypothetical protein [Treponema sp.]